MKLLCCFVEVPADVWECALRDAKESSEHFLASALMTAIDFHAPPTDGFEIAVAVNGSRVRARREALLEFD